MRSFCGLGWIIFTKHGVVEGYGEANMQQISQRFYSSLMDERIKLHLCIPFVERKGELQRRMFVNFWGELRASQSDIEGADPKFLVSLITGVWSFICQACCIMKFMAVYWGIILKIIRGSEGADLVLVLKVWQKSMSCPGSLPFLI